MSDTGASGHALISFSGHCDDNVAALRAAANILLKLTDYRAVLQLANGIIHLVPNNDNGYYLRAVAYDGLKSPSGDFMREYRAF